MILICDIDGTLADIKHRKHLVEKGRPQWDEFFEAMGIDEVNYWCKELLECMSARHEIVYVTGRPENYREHTEEWMSRHNIPSGRLYMRKEGDRRPDNKVKSDIFDEHLKDKEIIFVLEDRKRVVDMWRSKGLTVLQCEEGDF